MSTPTPPDSPDLSFEATLRGLKSGQKVFANRYTLLRLLGRGGMGVVWLARDDELGKDIALKFLPEYVATDKAAMEDLKEETKKTLDLTHPHIVRTYTFLTDQEHEMAAIAMEHVDGLNLSDLRMDQEGRVFEVVDAQFQRWVGHLCGALAYAHAKKRIVHRDLKPSNLMVNSEGELKVSDFGIARSLTESRTRLSRQSGASGGTLPYMSPQQALGERPTESDDIYSLGATLYELLTGKPPFYSGEIFEQIKTKEPPPITERRAELNVQSNQPVPDQWERAVLSCLAKKPADRPASVAALARLLSLEGDFPESAPGALQLAGASSAGPRSGANAAGPSTSHGSKLPGGKRWQATALQGLAALIVACACYWWFGMEKPKRDQANTLVAEAQAAFLKDDRAEAQSKLTAALALQPSHPGAERLRTEMEKTLQEAIDRWLGKADSALARKDMLAAREAYGEVLALRADHPRASAGLAGLKDIVGGLEVKTSPAGAKVQVGGLDSATSPCTLKALPLGKHRITVTLDGFDPVTEEIILRNDSFVPFDQKLVRQRGAWKIESTPTGMDCSVKMTASVIQSDDELKFTKTGKTPVTLENLPTGDYEVRLTRPGWPDVVRTVPVRSASSESITHEFAEGTLTLESTPPGMEAAFLKADGTAFASGKTPLVMKSIPTGPGYRVTMKRPGWPDFEKTDVTIVKGSNPGIEHEFAQGILVITSEPNEAEVEFLGPNGQKIASGKTPLTIKDQPIGTGYIALLRRIGWPVNKLDVTIAKGENTANAEFAEGSLRVESTPPGCEFEVRAVSEELAALKKELAEKEARYAVKGLSKDENATLKARLGELRELIGKQEIAFKPRTGKTPMDVTALPTGSHQITVKCEGWPDFVKVVQVVKGTNPPVAWEFGEGTVNLTSDPVGCEVWLGKRLLGKTPCEAKVPNGKVQLACRHKLLGEKIADVPATKNQSVSASWSFQYGRIEIVSVPAGAAVTWKGARLGTTPLSLDEMPIGTQTFKLDLADHDPGEVTVTVNHGARANTSIKLDRNPLAAVPANFRQWFGTYAPVMSRFNERAFRQSGILANQQQRQHLEGTMSISISSDRTRVQVKAEASGTSIADSGFKNTWAISFTREFTISEFCNLGEGFPFGGTPIKGLFHGNFAVGGASSTTSGKIGFNTADKEINAGATFESRCNARFTFRKK